MRGAMVMKYKFCKRCGRHYSDDYYTCPHCDKEQFEKEKDRRIIGLTATRERG